MIRIAPTPVLERIFPAPEAIREEIVERAHAHLRYERPRPISQGAKSWMEDCRTVIVAGSLWIAQEGFLRRHSLPDAHVEGEWALPDSGEAFASAGIRPATFDSFEPVFALDGERILWLLRGYTERDGESPYFAVPVIFDPRGAPPWRILRAREPRTFLPGTGARALVRGERTDVWVLASEHDVGGDASDIMLSTGYELDFANGTHRFLSEAPADPFEDHLLKVPMGIDFIEGRTSLTAYAKTERLSFRLLEHDGFERTELLLAPDSSPPTPKLSAAGFSGCANRMGALVHDYVGFPGARRIAVWLPEPE